MVGSLYKLTRMNINNVLSKLYGIENVETLTDLDDLPRQFVITARWFFETMDGLYHTMLKNMMAKVQEGV